MVSRSNPAKRHITRLVGGAYWLSFSLALTLVLGTARAQSLEDLVKPQEGRSMRSTSAAVDKNGDYAHSNSDNSRVKQGVTKVVLDAQGPGVITHMWFTFLAPEPHAWAKNGSATHQEMLLRIYYDGSDRPAIEAPLGEFFANCFGRRAEVISVPVVVEDADSYNCFWRMPFRKSIRIEIVNQSEKNINLLYYNIDWIKKDRIPDDTPYFYAQYRQEYPVEQGKDYVILETEGKGHYVGTVMAVRSRSPSWFGEGDEKIYIDGDKKASIWGTGTEDYFLSAWGLKTTSTPYFGTSYFDQWGIVGGHTAAYRWHIADPIVFQKSIKVTIEHWGWISADETPDGKVHSWNERQDDFCSVAFWYQTGTPTFAARAPHAKKRILPNLDIIHLAKEFVGKAKHGVGEQRLQTNLGFYPQGQYFMKPLKAEGAFVEIPFSIKREKEPRRLLLNVTRAPDYGRYQAYLNGVKLGRPFDLYNSKVAPWEWHLLDFWPEPGDYTLRLECVGKNPKSTGYGLGVESVRLRERRPRVKEWARDKDKDWKKEPVLYN